MVSALPGSSRCALSDSPWRHIVDKYYPTDKPNWVSSTISALSRDESKDARAFVAAIPQWQPTNPTPNGVHRSTSDSTTTSAQHTFSRPPPPLATDPINVEAPPIELKPTRIRDGSNHADAVPSPKTSPSALKNGYDHETKPVTSKTKDGVVGRPGISPRTKSGRVSR